MTTHFPLDNKVEVWLESPIRRSVSKMGKHVWITNITDHRAGWPYRKIDKEGNK